MEFVKVNYIKEIESLIKEFLPCFPNLSEKIDDIYAYVEKTNSYAEVYRLTDYVENRGISIFYANDFNRGYGYISLIGIKEIYQRQHLGADILMYTHDIMREKGMLFSKLEVDKDNLNAYGFYLYEGYEYLNTATETSDYLVFKL